MGRLFWKIFLWFCLTLMLISLAVGWAVKIYVEMSDNEFREEVPLTQVTALAVAIEQSGREQARGLLMRLHQEIRHPIFVLDSDGQDILRPRLPPRLENLLSRRDRHPDRFVSREAWTPEGEKLEVIAPAFKNWRARHQRPPKAPLWLMVSIALLVGLILCFWLARYLSRPVIRLSRASRALADGNLQSRVGNQGGRRDEIADLAGDFDLMAERIQHLLQSQKQLLSDISHELRSPLARLQVALALARRQNTADPAALDRIERDILRMEALIGELLTLSRLESGPETPLDETIVITPFLEEIIEETRIEAAARKCKIELQCNMSESVKGNTELLRRAVENVIRNAILYTAANSLVEISVNRLEDRIRISVCDRGPGVPEPSLNTLFDPFFRTDSARERRTGGHGLGLAIARRSVEIHGGLISAQNRTDGPGLCIHLELPTLTDGRLSPAEITAAKRHS